MSVMRVPLTLDLHLPNFNYPGVESDQLFEKLVEIAQTAERSGFSSVSLMDHLHQIEMVGPPENWMFEGSTMLAAIAARTEKLSLGLLVGSVTYRNPALAAKITTTLDIISGGRAWHGIGAGWFEQEHIAYGFEYPELKYRFERLEEALQIARLMFTEVLPGRRRLQQPQADPWRHSDPDRRQRRAQDAPLRRQVRRRLQPVRRYRDAPTPAQRAPRPLRRRRARSSRDHQDGNGAGDDRSDLRGRSGQAPSPA